MTSTAFAGVSTLSQCFVVPNTVNSATVSWTDEIRNFASAFEDPQQEFRVLLSDAVTGNPIGDEIFSTDPGNTLVQATTSRSFDLTAALQAIPGQSVCLTFAQEDRRFFMHVSLDDVSLLIDSPEEPQRLIAGSVVVRDRACTPALSPNQSGVFTPDGEGGYDTSPNSGVVDMEFRNGVPLDFADDSVRLLSIGFPFSMPGGVILNEIDIDSNGRAFEPSAENSDFSQTVAELRFDATSMLCPFWVDLNPDAGGQIWQSVGPNGEFVVTWDEVPRFGGTEPNSFQMVLCADGSVSFNFFEVTSLTGIVGLSAGNGVADPGAIDLSLAPTSSGGAPIVYESFGLSTSENDLGRPQSLPELTNLSRPVLGQDFDLQISGLDATPMDFYIVGDRQDFDARPLGIACTLECDGALGAFVVTPGSVVSLEIPSSPSLSGLTLSVQGGAIDPEVVGLSKVLLTNSIDFTIGSL